MTPTPDILSQYEALTRGVGFAPLLGRTIIEVTGSDRVQFLQSFTTNDVKRRQPGQGCEAFVTSTQGKTLGHVWIFCANDRHIIDTTPGQATPLIDHFNRYVISEDVTFVDKTSDFVDLLIAGAGAEAALVELAGGSVPHELYDHGTFKFLDIEVTIHSVDYAGAASFILRLHADGADAVTNAIASSGAIACGHTALESARLEAGYPLFGLDITPENLPQEIARDTKAISFTKGCYLGQETVARIDAIGHVNRLLVGAKFPGTEIPPPGTELIESGQKVGEVTSAAWSPLLQAPLALALVRRSYAKVGSQLDSNHGPACAVAVPLAGNA